MSFTAVVNAPAVVTNLSDRMYAVVTWDIRRAAVVRCAKGDGGEPLIMVEMEGWWLCAEACVIAAHEVGDVIEVEPFERRWGA